MIEELERELSLPPKNEEEAQTLARKVMDFMNFFEIKFRAKQPLDLQKKTLRRTKREIGAIDDVVRGEILQRMKESGLSVPKIKQISHHADAFMEYNFRRQVEGKISPARKDSIRDRLQYYLDWTNISRVDKIATKDHIDAFYAYVWNNVFVAKTEKEGKISDYRGRDVMQVFLQFIRWLADEQIIKEFPSFVNGRKDKKYTIKIGDRKVRKISIKDVRLYIEHAAPRMKLYLMLILNCGFGQGEIGRLQKDEYDPKKGRIIHKRCKEKDHDEVPTVTYLLWDETKALLDQAIEEQKKFPQREEYTDYLLLNTNGRAIWREKSEGADEYSKTDNIKNRFQRLRTKLKENGIVTEYYHFYQIRKLPPSLIKSRGKQFGTDYRLWLGHAAAGVAERHYIDDDEVTLDPCIQWLYEQIFGESALEDELVDEIEEKIVEE